MDYSAVLANRGENSDHQEPKPVSTKALAKKPDPMDPAPLLNLFSQYKAKVAEIRKEAETLEVVDDESSADAAEKAGQCKKIENAIDKTRKKAIAPYQDVVKIVNSHCQKITLSIVDARLLVERKNRPYLVQKEKERREAEEKAKAEAARLQREAEEKARMEAEAQGNDAPPVVVPEIVPDLGPTATKIKTDSGSQKLETKWDWELLDIRMLPDACFEERAKQLIDAVSPWINTQVKAGVRSLGGVRIFKKQVIKTRAGR